MMMMMMMTKCSKAYLSKNSLQYSRRGVSIELRIKELGYDLPPCPPEPKGSYMTYLRHGNTV